MLRLHQNFSIKYFALHVFLENDAIFYNFYIDKINILRGSIKLHILLIPFPEATNICII